MTVTSTPSPVIATAEQLLATFAPIMLQTLAATNPQVAALLPLATQLLAAAQAFASAGGMTQEQLDAQVAATASNVLAAHNAWVAASAAKVS